MVQCLGMVVGTFSFGQGGIGEDDGPVGPLASGDGGPAVIGGTKERHEGHAERGRNVARAGVVGDHDGGGADDLFETADGVAERGERHALRVRELGDGLDDAARRVSR